MQKLERVSFYGDFWMSGSGNDRRLITPGAFADTGQIIGNADQFRQLPLPAGLPVWITGVYEDGEGRHWQELNVGLLVQSPEFLKVGVFE